jgi:putative ABC transport system permease protein
MSAESAARAHLAPSSAQVLWALLRQFSWQELRHHGVRHGTAVLAVLLGVALAFSVHLINESALSEFSAAVRSVNGQADLSLRSASGGLAEGVYAQVAQHPQVKLASPIIEVQTLARDAQGKRLPLKVLGLDAMVSGPLSPQLMPQLAQGVDRLDVFAPDSIFLNAKAQRQFNVKPGESLQVQSGLAFKPLRVVGSVAGGNEALGVMDIGSAQATLGTLGQITRVDVQLAPGAQAATVLASLHLPAGVVADTASDATQRVSNVSRAYRVNLTVLALVALFTGGFLVFSILSLSVAKRQQQLALLGVLGLSSRERLALVLAESAVMGAVGSVLGLALGTGLAALALRLLSGDLGGGYFPGITPSLHWSPWAALLYGVLGVLAAMLGGWVPARTAQRLAPAQALKGLGDAMGQSGWPWLGPLLMLAGLGLAQLPAINGVPLWAYLSVAALLMGGIVSVPLVVGLVLQRLPAPRQPAALLALERARRMRHTATVAMAGVVASLSLSVALTVMVGSFRGSVTQWLDTILPADLYARATNSSGGGSEALHFDPALLQGLAQVPGVTRVHGLRITSLRLNAQLSEVALISRPLADPSKSLPLVGNLVPAQSGVVSIYVSEAMVDLHGARLGQTLALPLRPGQPAVHALVRGVWRDYARQQGAIVMDEADYQRLTGDTRINDLALWLAPGSRTDAVEAGIRQATSQSGLAGELIEFAEPRQIRETTLRIFDRSFAVTYWLQAVAIGIGLFGTAASFSAQVLARRKEFGLLRHLGFTRGQILATVGGEGLALSSIGALLGLALGLAVSVVLVKVVNPQSFHWTMDLLLPWPRLALLCGGVIFAGTVTALLAGRHAAGSDAVMAVKEDW